ncbi:hypothetical protein [Pseudokineococcus sp. 1T1Z-3]|uniref:hypothetical protein n=1 Tax=Pseudokineococcus sp. 1T1Z-3 TaxID=3132745 RepID=UPI0030B28D61
MPEVSGATRDAPPLRAGRVVLGWWALVAAAVLAWWLLAPQPEVVTDGAQRVAPGLPELAAAQDGTFVLVTAAAGALMGLGLLRVGPTADRVVVMVLTALGGAYVTSFAGTWLGGWVAGPRRAPALPEDIGDTLVDGASVASSQLTLSSDVALAVWPVAAALVVTGVLIARLLRGPVVREAEDEDQ